MQQHVFQPVPLDLYEINPFRKIANDWMVISAGTREKANSMTASWGGMGTLWNKDVVTIFVRESRYTKEFLDQTDGFSCSFFGKENRAILKYFGSVSGRSEDKIANAKMHYDYIDGIPYINEADTVMICKTLAAVPIEKEHILLPELLSDNYSKGDYHTMYVGNVTMLGAR